MGGGGEAPGQNVKVLGCGVITKPAVNLSAKTVGTSHP